MWSYSEPIWGEGVECISKAPHVAGIVTGLSSYTCSEIMNVGMTTDLCIHLQILASL